MPSALGDAAALGHGHGLPDVASLDLAVQHASLPDVFAILASWSTAAETPDYTGPVPPGFTTSALLSALSINRPDIVSLLLSVEPDGLPIKEAIAAGHSANFQAFLWHGWDVNGSVERDGPSALGYAVKNETLVTWLLQRGADPNAGYKYDTPLSRAALTGSIDVLNTMLSHGGDVQRGQVLHWAVERQSDCCEVVTILLRRGASPNQMEFDGVFPIWSVLQILGTPLHKAVALGKAEVVARMLEYGADPEKKDTAGKTARAMAIELGRDDILSLIVQ
ncbi:hypothetical protein LTR86_004985 [Recurvomyces mirabilis]|nr:hypothetical protein LTR86_004985 [Recurvomyces mirabilis]